MCFPKDSDLLAHQNLYTTITKFRRAGLYRWHDLKKKKTPGT